MTAELTGRVALVTGAGRRVGRAIGEGLGRAGARVAVHYHTSREGAESLVADLNRNRGDVAESQAFQADLRDARAAAELPRRVVEAMGRLDVVVNSASVMVRQPFGTVTPEEWDAVLAINLRAYFFVAQGAADALRASRGKIVNISDLSAFEAWPGYLPHSVSKAGVETLTRGLARVLAPEVCVNAVCPGPVLLPDSWGPDEAQAIVAGTPLKRLGSPADVAEAVLYLVSADYVTGTTLFVDGGRHLAPRSH